MHSPLGNLCFLALLGNGAPGKYLSYYQGGWPDWRAADQQLLRRLIPENRQRVYDVRKVIEALVDTGWFLELRRDWAPGMITGFIGIEGWPLGLTTFMSRTRLLLAPLMPPGMC